MTTSLLSLLGGGGGGAGGIVNSQLILKSRTMTVRKTGKMRLTLAGGAGSGGVAIGIATAAVGGAAGGFLQVILDVIAGQTITLTIGAGGLGATVTPGVASAAAGNLGGTSTVVVGSKTFTCPGGAGGGAVQGAAGTGASFSLPGALGGVPTGGVVSNGDVVATGGGSGSIVGQGATGGGALNILNLAAADIQSGSITVAVTGGNAHATGGASPGGKSGSITVNTWMGTGGGGMGGPGVNNATTPGPNAYGLVATASPVAAIKPNWYLPSPTPVFLDGGGSPGFQGGGAGLPSAINGGAAGAIASISGVPTAVATGLMCGNSGIHFTNTGTAQVINSAAGGLLGGASGGIANEYGSSPSVASSGAGGDGWAILEEIA